MTHTHRKKQYTAHCVQLDFDGYADTNNFAQMIDLLRCYGCEATPYNGQLMLRWEETATTKYHIEMMRVGDWLRIGENGVAKIMSDEEFKLKYEEIEK